MTLWKLISNFPASDEYKRIPSIDSEHRLPSGRCDRPRVVFVRNEETYTPYGGQDLVEVFTETFDEPGLSRDRVFLFPDSPLTTNKLSKQYTEYKENNAGWHCRQAINSPKSIF